MRRWEPSRSTIAPDRRAIEILVSDRGKKRGGLLHRFYDFSTRGPRNLTTRSLSLRFFLSPESFPRENFTAGFYDCGLFITWMIKVSRWLSVGRNLNEWDWPQSSRLSRWIASRRVRVASASRRRQETRSDPARMIVYGIAKRIYPLIAIVGYAVQS